MRPRSAPLLLTATLALAGCTGEADPPAPSGSAPGTSGAAPTDVSGALRDARTLATGLDVPWGLAFLPDRSMLVTERDSTRVLRLPAGGGTPREVGRVADAAPDNEGGVMGVAVSPRFSSDSRVFVMYSGEDDNRVVRYRLTGDRLVRDKVIVDGLPVGPVHNGGRLAFGPDGRLYIGAGDAGDREQAQDRSSLGGKILRVDQDGRAPSDNPWRGSPVWSTGHRNVQGLAWDSDGRMFATEFGQDTWDELNRIRKGGNYGWPRYEGRAQQDGFIDPIAQWRPRDASPSGLAIDAENRAYVAALGGQALIRVTLDGDRAGDQQRLLDGTLGRIRTVALGPDRRLDVISSNTFRGSERDGDDRIVSYAPR